MHNGRSMRNITIVLLLFSICFASEHERPKTNREMLFRLCDSAMSEIVSSNTLGSMPVNLDTGNDTISSYYREQFIQSLVSRNIPVFLRNDSTKTTLKLSVQESSVFFSEVFTESFLGERRTERKIQITIFASLVSNSDKRVISVYEASKNFVDTVAYSIVDQINVHAPPVSSYVKPELTFFDSIVEPAIVTIASGVAIYLFFTIRS
jgi:hypothetical protein